MESTFIYDRPVTGKFHIGRKADVEKLVGRMRSGLHTLITAPPKSGVTSLVRQALLTMKSQKEPMVCLEASLMGVRSLKELCLELGSQFVCSVASAKQEIAETAFRYFSGTGFEYDSEGYAASGRVLSLRRNPSRKDVRVLLQIPCRMAADTSRKVCVVLDGFQNIAELEDPSLFLDELCRAAGPAGGSVVYVLCAGRVNAMKAIMEWPGNPLAKLVDVLEPSPIPQRDIINSVTKAFLSGGKVIEEDRIVELCRITRCNPWYMNHFCAICDGISKGYIVTPVVRESLGALISIHQPRFRGIMDGLTTFQASLLRAILEGQTRFSSVEVISRYGLNSSANVRRLKDALCRKEIITFRPDDTVEILDPLFEYWATKHYFKIKWI